MDRASSSGIGDSLVGTTAGDGTTPADWMVKKSSFIRSMSAAKWSTLEESSSLAAVFVLLAGTLARHYVPDLFCTRASALCAVTGWKEGRLARRSNWACHGHSQPQGGQAAATIVIHDHMEQGSPQGALTVRHHRERECLPSTLDKSPDQVGRVGRHAPITNQVMSSESSLLFFFKK